MLASLVNRSPVVRVTLDDSEVFVNPVPLPGHRSVDPVVRGTVLLELSTARAIKKVKVILEGQCDVFGKSQLGGLPRARPARELIIGATVQAVPGSGMSRL